jgi:formyl-CoA transferase
VENPAAPDPVRLTGAFVDGASAAFAQINRNKESVALDLKSPPGCDAFLRLARWADVVVENLRPGAMRGLGLGPADLHAINPRLVYASASSWGQSGPLTEQPGLDIMAQARGGLMSITGEPDGDPVKCGVPVADLSAALHLALAVTAALRARDRNGRGEVIDVSLYESVVSLAVWEAARYFARGEVGSPSVPRTRASRPTWRCGRPTAMSRSGAVTPATWPAFCAALDLGSLLDDDRFRTASTRHEHRAELVEFIECATTRPPPPGAAERDDPRHVRRSPRHLRRDSSATPGRLPVDERVDDSRRVSLASLPQLIQRLVLDAWPWAEVGNTSRRGSRRQRCPSTLTASRGD